MIGLDQLMSVYIPNTTNGDYTTLVASDIPCRLVTIGVRLGTDLVVESMMRAEDAGRRRLLWGPDYAMSELSQVAVEGKKWDITMGSLVAIRGPDSNVVYNRVEVIEAPP